MLQKIDPNTRRKAPNLKCSNKFFFTIKTKSNILIEFFTLVKLAEEKRCKLKFI